MYLSAGFNHKEIPLKSYVAENPDISASALSSADFTPCSYVNAFSEKGTVWLQADIPVNTAVREREVLYFSPEVFFTAEVFFEDAHGKWISAGKTGSGVPHSKTSLGAWHNAVSLVPVLGKHAARRYAPPNSAKPITLRIRLTASHPAHVRVFAMSLNTFMTASSLISFYLAFALAACIVTALFIVFNALLFKDWNSIFFAIVCALLVLHIFIAAGTFFGGVMNNFVVEHYMYKANYVFICLVIICAIVILHKTNAPVIRNFTKRVRSVFNMLPLFNMAIAAFGILYFILDISDSYGRHIVFAAMTFALLFFTAQCRLTLLYNPVVRKKICITMLVSLYLLVFQQFSHAIRFWDGSSGVFRIFDHDLDLPEVIALMLFGMTAFIHIQAQVRDKLAYLQVSTESAKEKTTEAARLSCVYSQLSLLLLDPLQLFSAFFDRCYAHGDRDTLTHIKDNIEYSRELINALHFIATHENTTYIPKENCEAVNLHDFILGTIKNSLSSFYLNSCTPDIRESFEPDVAVTLDKSLTAIVFKFVIETVVRRVTPGTNILISIDYVNCTLMYSLHFYSEPILNADLQNVLELTALEAEDDKSDGAEFEAAIENWGIYLYVVRRLLQFFNGNIEIIPDAEGNTIIMRMALPPASPTAEKTLLLPSDSPLVSGSGNDEAAENKNSSQKEPPLYSENIYILEENSAIRRLLKRELSPFFRTIAFSTGAAFFKEARAVKPDLILCSISLPGKNALELLKEKDTFGEVPFIVMANFVTPQNVTHLLQRGATDVIQKPFNIDHLILRITNIMNEKRINSISAIESIKSVLQESILQEKEGRNGLEKDQSLLPSARKPSPAAEKMKRLKRNARFVSAGLTKKEIAIAHHVADGWSDKEIALELDIAVSTVAVHNRRIFKKLGVHSRNELASPQKEENEEEEK